MQTERRTESEEETRTLGAELGAAVRPGDVLLLAGLFGAGKTTLVQGIARGLGVSGPVTSPSFVIANEHQGRIPLYHVDLYRIERMDDATLEALAEYFESDGVCVVEWPDPLPVELVHRATRIDITHSGEDARQLQMNTDDHRLLAAFAGTAARR